MAISIPTNATQNSGTSLSIACSGNRRCLVVFTVGAQTSVSYAGIALTNVKESKLWILFNPPTGTASITLSTSSAAMACCLNNISESTGVIISAYDAAVGTNDCVNDLSPVVAGDIEISGMNCDYGYGDLVSGTGITYATKSGLAYKLATTTTVSVTWGGDDNKHAYGLALRGDDSLEDAGVSAVSLSDYGVM